MLAEGDPDDPDSVRIISSSQQPHGFHLDNVDEGDEEEFKEEGVSLQPDKLAAEILLENPDEAAAGSPTVPSEAPPLQSGFSSSTNRPPVDSQDAEEQTGPELMDNLIHELVSLSGKFWSVKPSSLINQLCCKP